MTKRELIDILSDNFPHTKKEIASLVDELINVISDSLARGEEVSLHQLGKFIISKSPAHTGRNPQTGQPIMIPPQRKVRFRPAAALKKHVNR